MQDFVHQPYYKVHAVVVSGIRMLGCVDLRLIFCELQVQGLECRVAAVTCSAFLARFCMCFPIYLSI